jgi:hypothetical protein
MRPLAYTSTRRKTKKGNILDALNVAISDLLIGYEDLSGDDREVVDKIKREQGADVSMYVVTATTIQRYAPWIRGSNQIQTWKKAPPARMMHLFK